MKTNVVVQTTALSKVTGNGALREGSSVYVRVIKNNGNNSYIVAFSGGRFSIKSEVALKEGAGFLAKIKISDGKILLQKLENQKPVNNTIQKLSSEGQKVFLQNLGLVPDNISLSLFQQMKELGLKFNQTMFAKARKVGLAFKGKEKQAAEIAFLLESKGLQSDEEAVEKILDDEGWGDIDHSRTIELVQEENNFKSFFQKLLAGAEGQSNPAGILALFNHLGFSFESPKSYGNWIKVPFEFENPDAIGKGVFCGFIRNDTRKIDKASVEFKVGDRRYFFGLHFGSEGINSLQAGCSDEKGLGPLLEGLQSSFPEISVEYMEPGSYSQFFAEDTGIEIFRGQA